MSLSQKITPKELLASSPSRTKGVTYCSAALLALADPIGIAGLSVGLAAFSHAFGWYQIDGDNRLISFGVAAAGLFSTTMHLRGMYGGSSTKPEPSINMRQVLLTWSVACLCLTAIALVLKPNAIPAPFAFASLFVGAGFFLVSAFRAMFWRQRWIAPSHRCIAVVTTLGDRLPSMLAAVVQGADRRISLEVSIPNSAEDPGLSHAIDALILYVRQKCVDDVVLALNHREIWLIDQITEALRVVPARIWLLPDETTSALLQKRLLPVGPVRPVALRTAPLSTIDRLTKRVLDLVAALTILTIVSPAMALIAIAIRLDSHGPVFFRQRRIGFNGQPFQIVKFRTMTVMEDGPSIRQACRGDVRITRIGGLLRRYSLDELPQLFNVLKGEMSLVGPRPHAVAHDVEYGKTIASYAARHNVKPGMTGWAQVNGWRGETPELSFMVRRIEHDLWYVDHWSLWLDLKILVLTACGRAGGTNAW